MNGPALPLTSSFSRAASSLRTAAGSAGDTADSLTIPSFMPPHTGLARQSPAITLCATRV